MEKEDPCRQYRLLRQEQKKLREDKQNTQTDLLLYAKYPEYFLPAKIEEIRERDVALTRRLTEIVVAMNAMERIQEVRAMLMRELGIASSYKDTWMPSYKKFSEIEERPICWLWEPYLSLGRVTLLEGDPGQGKSWFALAVSACVSLGSWLEVVDQGHCSDAPRGVVYITCEDDPEDTIKKRLRVLQANMERIVYLSGKTKGKGVQTQCITMSDLEILREVIGDTYAKLVVIDPIQGFLPKGVEMNRAEQVRPMLDALQKMATDSEVAFLLIRHLSKGSKDRGLYRGMGSIDFTATARSVLVCAERKELEQWSTPEEGKKPILLRRRFIVAQVKNNLGPRGPSVEFELQKDGFFWVGTSNITADQLLAPDDQFSNPQSVQEAKVFLLSELQREELEGVEIKRRARRAGINARALSEAKRALNIDVHASSKGWCWFLPGKYMTL